VCHVSVYRKSTAILYKNKIAMWHDIGWQKECMIRTNENGKWGETAKIGISFYFFGKSNWGFN